MSLTSTDQDVKMRKFIPITLLLIVVATIEVKSENLSSLLDSRESGAKSICADIIIGRNFKKSLCLIAWNLTFNEAKDYCKHNGMKFYNPKCLRMGERCRTKFLSTFDIPANASVWLSSSNRMNCKSLSFPSISIADVSCSEKRWSFCVESTKKDGKASHIK